MKKRDGEEIDYRIIYLSLMVIMTLAVIMHLTIEDIQSITALFVIFVIVLGNIAYIYLRPKKHSGT